MDLHSDHARRHHHNLWPTMNHCLQAAPLLPQFHKNQGLHPVQLTSKHLSSSRRSPLVYYHWQTGPHFTAQLLTSSEKHMGPLGLSAISSHASPPTFSDKLPLLLSDIAFPFALAAMFHCSLLSAGESPIVAFSCHPLAKFERRLCPANISRNIALQIYHLT